MAVAPDSGDSERRVTPQALGIRARSSFTQALLPRDLVGIRGLKMTTWHLASPGWVGCLCSVLPQALVPVWHLSVYISVFLRAGAVFTHPGASQHLSPR